LKKDFDERGVKTIGISCNELNSHDKWIEDINEVGNVNVDFPIVADPTREIAKLYDMLGPSTRSIAQLTA